MANSPLSSEHLDIHRALPENGNKTNGGANISDTTFESVRNLIVHGNLAPGSRVIEADLAERLHVSRTPIRSALHRLRQEGYIIVTSDTGNKARLAISPLTQDDARELYHIVGHLEGLAVRSIARLSEQERTRLVEELARRNDGLREVAEGRQPNPNLIFELDMNFHQTLINACAGPRLRALHDAIDPQTERYWRLYASAITDQLGISVGEHTVVIESIQRGDLDAAERALQMNWQNGAERLCRVIETIGERGSW